MIIAVVAFFVLVGILYINIMVAIESVAEWQRKEMGGDNGESKQESTD